MIAWVSRKAGGSSSVRRMMYATTTTTAESQNGTRHPQLISCSSGRDENGMNTASARRPPEAEPLVTKLVVNARRSSGACSRLMLIAAACSPETERPWMMRMMTSRMGAATPISE